jgi:hypothetical protein
MITIFCLAISGQLSFGLWFFSEEGSVELAHFFQLIFKNLRLCHLLYCDLQRLIFVLRMLNQCLHKERIRSMLRRCSRAGCRALTSI